MIRNINELTAQGEALPKCQGVSLSCNVQRSTIHLAVAKSTAGRENPRLSLVPTHAPAWFFVGARSSFLEAALLYLLGSFCCVMAVRAGQPQGWPVSKVAGFSPLSGLPPMSVRTPSGRENLTTLEAAIMATVPTPALSSRLRSLTAHPCHSAALRRICAPPPCGMKAYRLTPPDGGLIL